MSITLRWRILLASTSLILTAGAILLVILSLRDLPRAGPLQWSSESLDDWPVQETSNLVVYDAPSMLPEMYTLELSALNYGPADSAWGIQFSIPNDLLTILIDNQGYVSIHQGLTPQWAEFPHIHPGADNALYVDVDHNGIGTLRINEEILVNDLQLSGPGPMHWNIITYRQPELTWSGIALYHQ